MKKLLSCLLLSVAATSALTTSAQAGTFYVSTNDYQIGAFDDLTGSYTQLASTPTFTDIALSPSEQLFGITFNKLYSVDLELIHKVNLKLASRLTMSWINES